MNDTPLVTIITPYYNNSETIFDSMSSVLNQSYKNIQYIIIDDGSKSFDYESINNYLDNYANNSSCFSYMILQNSCNLGTTKSLNRALKETTGKFIFLLAADDCFCDSKVIEDWTNEFVQTKANVITAKRNVYDNTMTSLKYITPNKKEEHYLSTLSNKDLFETICITNYIFGCCTAFNTEFLIKLGGFDEKYRLIEDHPLFLKLLRNNMRINFYDRSVINYRQGGISNAGNINRKYLKEADKIFFHEALPYVINKNKRFRQYYKRRQYLILRYDQKHYSSKFNKNTITGKLLYAMVICLLHPIYILKKIFTKQ